MGKLRYSIFKVLNFDPLRSKLSKFVIIFVLFVVIVLFVPTVLVVFISVELGQLLLRLQLLLLVTVFPNRV